MIKKYLLRDIVLRDSLDESYAAPTECRADHTIFGEVSPEPGTVQRLGNAKRSDQRQVHGPFDGGSGIIFPFPSDVFSVSMRSTLTFARMRALKCTPKRRPKCRSGSKRFYFGETEVSRMSLLAPIASHDT
jgi:hypothetical protein